jgi:hypothetical protein
VLEIPKNSGIERLIDFFERDAGGNFHVADFQTVPVEAAIAFLRFVRRAACEHLTLRVHGDDWL